MKVDIYTKANAQTFIRQEIHKTINHIERELDSLRAQIFKLEEDKKINHQFRKCSNCGAHLCNRNRTKLCRSCFMSLRPYSKKK